MVAGLPLPADAAPYGMPLEPQGHSGAMAPDEAALWARWLQGRAPEDRERLAERYLPYARALAARSYARRLHNEFEFDDYLHYAVVGMLEALDRYQCGRGAAFKTFATPRIQGAIIDGLDSLSERQQQAGLRRRLMQERVASIKTGGAGNDGHRLLQELSEIGVGLALGFLLEGTGMVQVPDERVADNAYAPMELRQLRERIWQLVAQGTPREVQVIRRHYLQQQPFEQIAEALQLTRGRVSQLHKQGLERIRRSMAAARVDVAW